MAGSIIPQGLLDEFTRDEIADLVAYVAARGDPSDLLVRSPARPDPLATRNAAATSDARCSGKAGRLPTSPPGSRKSGP